jgi:putative tryptophan/tyrosine transport system substrate-binding protein
LANPANLQNQVQLSQLREAARAIQLNVVALNASNERELESGFASMAEQKADAVMVLSDVFFTSNSPQLAALAARHRIPAIAHSREFAIAGGLMSYGTNLSEAYRWTGIYAGRILKGEKPADLPVIEPTRFDFLLNLKTARSLGLTVPPILLATADEVIE